MQKTVANERSNIIVNSSNPIGSQIPAPTTAASNSIKLFKEDGSVVWFKLNIPANDSAISGPKQTLNAMSNSKSLHQPVQIHSVSSNVRITPLPHSIVGTSTLCTTPSQTGPRPCTAASTSKTETKSMGSAQSHHHISPIPQIRQLKIMQVNRSMQYNDSAQTFFKPIVRPFVQVRPIYKPAPLTAMKKPSFANLRPVIQTSACKEPNNTSLASNQPQPKHQPEDCHDTIVQSNTPFSNLRNVPEDGTSSEGEELHKQLSIPGIKPISGSDMSRTVISPHTLPKSCPDIKFWQKNSKIASGKIIFHLSTVQPV
jgi:hypothetical protein